MVKSFALLASLILLSGCGKQQETKPLICHVGGTMQPAMQEIVALYEKSTGRRVEINKGGSGHLLAQIQGKKEGDLYVCHDPFIDLLMNKFKLGIDGWTVAEVTPVIVVKKGNPKGIQGIQDLTRKDISVCLTDYSHSSLGRMLPSIFEKAGIDFDQFNKDKKITTTRGGSQAANMVTTGNADVAMCWNAVAYLRRDSVDMIKLLPNHLPVPNVDAVTTATKITYSLSPVRVTLSTLACSRQKEAARAFAEFVISDEALHVFRNFGFTMLSKPVKEYENGQSINPNPVGMRPLVPFAGEQKKSDTEIRLYAGAGLRKAIEPLSAEFQKQTGIKVNVDYAGSGILISRAREDRNADLFMPGDVWYVDELQKKTGIIEEKIPVCYFVPVIIVQKGNPKDIKGLADFTRNDLRAALGNPNACQIGRLTNQIFDQSGIDRAAIKAKESVTVNELGVWVKMKDVDTAIVWDAIAINFADAVDRVEIPKEQNKVSEVVVGLMSTSKDKPSAREFIQFMNSDKGQKILMEKGYQTDVPYQ